MSNSLFHVAASKQLRKDLDEVLQRLKQTAGIGPGGAIQSQTDTVRWSPERSLAAQRITEGIMWLGMDLKAINEANPGACANPYPESKNPASPVVEPTADGLKL